MTAFALGIDLGTSGVRLAVIDRAGNPLADARASYGQTEGDSARPENWWRAVRRCLANQMRALAEQNLDPITIERIGVDGTSGSMVLVDESLAPVTRALMYSDGGFTEAAASIARVAPRAHITRGTGSSLARALTLQGEDTEGRGRHLLHQADFIIARLRGRGGASDENNSLKLGYDPETGSWPEWFDQVGMRRDLLPTVHRAGATLGPIDSTLAKDLMLSPKAKVLAGTTDSLAAFLACSDMQVGNAVTSLGTTLAIKIASETRVDAPEMGLYSHRLGGRWLVGGASNTGGGVLREFFSTDDLARLSAAIAPAVPSPLDYYPLAKPGERFPINDPDLQPRLTPRPKDDIAFLAGLLESIARIEARCYRLIAERGGPEPSAVLTAGGGAQNPTWTAIRRRVLGCPVSAAPQGEAAVGAAKLSLLSDR